MTAQQGSTVAPAVAAGQEKRKGQMEHVIDGLATGLGDGIGWLAANGLLFGAVAWVLLLPVMVGLWVWETSWPLVVRILVIAGLAGWNLLVFLPRALQGRP